MKINLTKVKQAMTEGAANLSGSVLEKAGDISHAVAEKAGSLTESVRDSAIQLGDAAKAKGIDVLEGWVAILPALNTYGLHTTSFGLAMSLNPRLDVELRGEAALFTPEYLAELIENNKENTYLKVIFNAVKTTLSLHSGAQTHPIEPLLVKIQVKLSPEIQVYLGSPHLT